MKLKDRIDSTESWWDQQLRAMADSEHTARWWVAILAALAVLILVLWARGCTVAVA